ncbi:hypothetical protein IMSAG049_00252 [Clostridiales bacterium]|nr:hypothetical protein IMSAG049_00252 [Clostridiales bacterium]
MNNVILRIGNYTLIDREYEYVVACNYDKKRLENQQWDNGIYFTHFNRNELEKTRMLSRAIECFRKKVDEEYISRSRLEEIATNVLQEYADNDRDIAIEYYKNELELTEFEYKYFGVNTENKDK